MKLSPAERLEALKLALNQFRALVDFEVAFVKAQEIIDFAELDEPFKIKPPPEAEESRSAGS